MVPSFRGVIFRRLFPEITNPNGLLDHCREVYSPYHAIYNHTAAEFRFPSGAKIALRTIQYDKDLNSFQGSQFDWVAFDEASQFPLKYVQYIWGRCRSKSGIRPSLRMSCNPDNDSWLYRLVYDWIDPSTGTPRLEMSGLVRHFIFEDGVFHWHDTEQYNENGRKITTSFTFIAAFLSDNVVLTESDPTYMQRLEILDKADRERFLDGNWLASSKTETEWPRELFMNVLIPLENFPVPEHAGQVVRMFSVDASKGKRQNKGDYSSICCVAQTKDLKYVDADLERRPPSQIVTDLFQFCEQPHHKIRSGDLIGVESLQFQELFVDLIMQYAASHPDYALSRFLKGGNIIIPIVDALPKHLRIRRLDGPITRREFRFMDNHKTSLLISQLRSFDGIQAKGKHDDGPDSLDMCLQLPSQLHRHYEDLNKATK